MVQVAVADPLQKGSDPPGLQWNRIVENSYGFPLVLLSERDFRQLLIDNELGKEAVAEWRKQYEDLSALYEKEKKFRSLVKVSVIAIVSAAATVVTVNSVLR